MAKTYKELMLISGIEMLIIGAALVPLFGGILPIGVAGYGLYNVGYYFLNANKYDKVFKNLDFCEQGQPLLKSRSEKEGYTQYIFSLPAGLSTEDFEKKQLAIEQYIGKKITIEYGFKSVIIKEFNETAKTIYEYESIETDSHVPVLIGYDLMGLPLIYDMADGEPHLLIAGQTGSGKSTLLRSIITNLIDTSEAEINLIDLKYGAEFSIFEKYVDKIAKTRSEAVALIGEVRKEIETRYNLITAHGATDISSYNSRAKNKLSYKVLVIDEFAELMTEKSTISMIEECVALARACGTHLILSSQRPDMKVINGRIKANCTTVIGLKTNDAVNSRIIIDAPCLEELRGCGHGWVRHKGKLIEMQAPYITSDEVGQVLKGKEKSKTIMLEMPQVEQLPPRKYVIGKPIQGVSKTGLPQEQPQKDIFEVFDKIC